MSISGPSDLGDKGAIDPQILSGKEVNPSPSKNLGLLLPPGFSDLPTALMSELQQEKGQQTFSSSRRYVVEA